MYQEKPITGNIISGKTDIQKRRYLEKAHIRNDKFVILQTKYFTKTKMFTIFLTKILLT